MLMKIKNVLAAILCTMLTGSVTFSSAETQKAKPCPEKIADYLFYMELDDYTFFGMPQTDSTMFHVGCAGIRKGDLYGRNLDLPYCETPEFVIRVHAKNGRFASIGVCADPTISCNVAEMSEAELLSMPNITNDGINENGVIISENVVIAEGIDDMRGTAPGKEQVHASRVVRYLLDRAASAAHAVELMKEIDIVGGFSGYALHWMIADEKDTFVVEIIHGELAVSRNEHPYMTNFYLNYGPIQETQRIAGNEFRNVPLLNSYAMGVERWCALRDGYNGIDSIQGMADLLASVDGSALYDDTKRPLRYSDCVGDELPITGSQTAFDEEMNRQYGYFRQRDREAPQSDWFTWHTSVYEIGNRTLHIYSQEDYSDCFSFQL